MTPQRKAIVRATVPIVIFLLLSLILIAFLSGGIEAVAATLGTLFILTIPLALLVGVVLFVMDRL